MAHITRHKYVFRFEVFTIIFIREHCSSCETLMKKGSVRKVLDNQVTHSDPMVASSHVKTYQNFANYSFQTKARSTKMHGYKMSRSKNK